MEISEESKSKYKVKRLLKISIFILFIFLIGLFAYEYIRVSPKEVHFTNVSANSVTVSWSTKSPVIGSVIYSKGEGGFPVNLFGVSKKKFFDTRDVRQAQLNAADGTLSNTSDSNSVSITNFETEIEVTDKGKYYTHHVEVSGLRPDTVYTFKIGDELLFRKIEDTSGVSTVKTSSVPEGVLTPVPAYGAIKDAKNIEDTEIDALEPVTDAVVYFNYLDNATGQRSNLFSSTVNESGNWYIDVSSAVDSSNEDFRTKYFDADNNTVVVELLVDMGPLGKWSRVDDILFTSPTIPIVINDPLQDNTQENSLKRVDALLNSLVKGVVAQTASFAGYCGPCEIYSQDSDGKSVPVMCNEEKLKERGCLNMASSGQENTALGDGQKTSIGIEQKCNDVDGCVCAYNSTSINYNDMCMSGTQGSGTQSSSGTQQSSSGDSKKTDIGPNEECKDSDGCNCIVNYQNKGTVLVGGICSSNTEGTDGNMTKIALGYQCQDEDGCVCSQNMVSAGESTYTGDRAIQSGQTCTALGDGKREGIGEGHVCQDVDGCICIPNSEQLVEQGQKCLTNTPSDGQKSETQDGERCTDEDGCKCMDSSDTSVENGDICSSQSNRDGLKGTITEPEQCSDLDGCVCLQYGNVAQGQSVGPDDAKDVGYNQVCKWGEGDGVQTELTHSQNCIDIDGCICNGVGIFYDTMCDIPASAKDEHQQLCVDTAGIWEDSTCVCPDEQVWSGTLGCHTSSSSGESDNSANAPKLNLNSGASPSDMGDGLINGVKQALKINSLTISAGDVCVSETEEGITFCQCLDGVDQNKYVIEGQYCRQVISCSEKNCELDENGELSICTKSGKRCLGVNFESSDAVKGIKEVSKIFSQDTTSNQYIFDQYTGLLSGLEAGQYIFEVDGEEYYVYISDDDLGANAGAVLIYIDKDGDGIYSEGIDTLVSDLAQTINISTISLSYTYYIEQGFNFVSFPFLTEDEEIRSAAGLLQSVNSEAGANVMYSLSKYDGTWKVVGQNLDVYDTHDFQLVPGQGYVLKANEDFELVITGNPIQFESESDSAAITLFEGWNLVGLYGTNVQAYTAKSLIQDINAYTKEEFTSDNVSKWDSDVQRYDGFQIANESGIDREYGFDYPLKFLQSYFVRVKEGNGNWQPQLAQ